MDEILEQISQFGFSNTKLSAGIGYIFVPSDIDRDTFVFNCYKNQTISFVTENSERLDNVKVNNSIFKDLKFPNSSKELGSLIFWVNIPKRNLPVVVAVLTKNDEIINLYEDQFELSRNSEDSNISIKGDAKVGELFINLDSINDSGGIFKININNKSNTGKLKIVVDGEVEIDSGKNVFINAGKLFSLKIVNPLESRELLTELKYELGVGLNYTDEFGNKIITNDSNIQLIPKNKLNVSEGSEQMMLGNTFFDIFTKFTDIVSALSGDVEKLQVGTAMGTSTTPVNVASFVKHTQDLNSLKEEYENFLSKISNTD